MSTPATTLCIGPGEPLPLGLSRAGDCFNVAIFSRHATGVSLLIFTDGEAEPIETAALDPNCNRTGDIWHVCLAAEFHGKSYAFRVEGPWSPEHGQRFDARVPLLDPYATALVGPGNGRGRDDGSTESALHPGGLTCALALEHRFDWQDDVFPRHAWNETIIYECHVRGLTIDPSSRVSLPGGYLGLIEKLPYLRALGITAVELMPVQEFREGEAGDRTGKPLRNYWGYNPVALFAPKAGYAAGGSTDAALTEFKTMVRALHRAGIEVILDVVFNHTAEGGENGPIISFRGLDNSIYYLLEPGTGRYLDFTGCGNTLNCNHPVVRSLIIDCLRHWVIHFHVDGFRFDLASILGRDSEGRLLPNPPLLEQIAEDPLLHHVKLIAEAWDLGGAFQVGHFPGRRWAQWNSDFRDDVRRFWRGDPGMTGAFASRLCGSADLFERDGESPVNSINFITCHDGFTLNDLVSYARKHNEANGEDNRDGSAENYSENNGTEGPTDDPAIDSVRLRQIKNFLVTLLVSRGVPMLLGGDEFRRTQLGNNNAYCQDNEISWHDWRLAEREAGLVRFVSRLIALRRAHPVLSAERFYSDGEIRWIGAEGRPPEWHGQDNRIGCMIFAGPLQTTPALCLLFNASLHACRFVLPPPPGGAWRIAVDTARVSPADIADGGGEQIVLDYNVVTPRSLLILTSG
jgi:isoamylase